MSLSSSLLKCTNPSADVVVSAPQLSIDFCPIGKERGGQADKDRRKGP